MLLAPFELYGALIIKVFLLLIKEHTKPQPWHVLDFIDTTTEFAFCSRQMCTLLLIFTVTFAF